MADEDQQIFMQFSEDIFNSHIRIDPCMVDISIALRCKISPSDDFETKLAKIPQSTTLRK